MDNRSLVFGIAGLGTVFGMLSYAFKRTAAPAAPPAAASASRPDERDARTTYENTSAESFRKGSDLLEQYLGGPVGRHQPAPAGSRPRLGVLIATLPDPYSSRLDWSFDAYLESIRRAMEAAGYVTDRFWFASQRANAVDTLHGVVDTLPAHEVQPGVLLFRGNKDTSRDVVLVYVAGEVPTGGIYQASLEKALHERARLLADSGRFAVDGVERDTVRILGPVFSGSVGSLGRVLDRWQAEAGHPTHIRVVSGSATSLANKAALEGAVPRLTFTATVNVDDAYLAAFDSVRRRLGIDARSVAMLVEGTTEYGRAVHADSGYLRIPFPLSISSLRAQWSKTQPRSASSLIMGSNEPRTSLSLIDSPESHDTPPTLSPLTPPALELLLWEITRALADHDIRAVGIVATDVRDKLFLADVVRSAMHDVLLFTFESNVLYARSEYQRAMHGALVFSTYPLFLQNQNWALHEPGRERLAFPNDAAVGVFNAALILMGRDGQAVEYVPPYARHPADASSKPPVWLTAVANGRLLPLEVGAPEQETAVYVTSTPAAGGQPAPPIPASPLVQFGFLVGLLSVGLVLLSAGLLRREILWLGARRLHEGAVAADAIEATPEGVRRGELGWLGHEMRRVRTRMREESSGAYMELSSRIPDNTPVIPSGTSPIEMFDEVERGTLLIHRDLFSATLAIATLGAFVPLAVLVLYADPPATIPWMILRGGVVVAALALLTAAVCRGVWATRYFGRFYDVGKRFAVPITGRTIPDWLLWWSEIAFRAAVAGVGVFFFIVALRFGEEIATMARNEPAQFALFAYRATQFGSGISPMVPLVVSALGFAAWSVWHLQRVLLLSHRTTPFEQVCLGRVARERRHRGRFDVRCGDMAGRLACEVAAVRRRLIMVVPDAKSMPLVIVLLVVAAWILPFGRSFETLTIGAMSGGRTSFDLVLMFGVAGTFCGTTWAVSRFIAVWTSLRGCLDIIAETPLLEAFRRLPPSVRRLTRLSIFGSPTNETLDPIRDAEWRRLRTLSEAFATSGAPPEEAERVAALTQSRLPHQGFNVYRDHASLDAGLGALADLVAAEWTSRAMTSPSAARDAGPASAAPLTGDRIETLRNAWLAAAEVFLAIHVLEYIEWVLRHFRRLAMFLLIALLLTTILLSAYPFFPQSAVKLLFLVVLLGAVLSLVSVMGQLSRDTVLSAVTDTVPGRISWDTTFMLNVALFAVIPIVAYVSSEFPAVRDALFSWVEPVVQAVSRS